jgi:tRNA threonylcarbamoyladenosine biosynthesis protein TsaB
MSKKPLLVFETSGAHVAAALAADGRVLAACVCPPASRHGAALLPITAELMQAQKLSPADLGGIGVSLGPGSWTGLRIGLSAAKSMAWGLGVELVGVPSFEALAFSVFERAELPAGTLILTLRTAYAAGVFAALFTTAESGICRVWDDRTLSEAELTAQLERLEAEGKFASTAERFELLAVGDAACLQSPAPAAWLQRPGRQVLIQPEIPPASAARCAWARYTDGRSWKTEAEIHRAAPLYLRRCDPELRHPAKPDGRGTA